MGARLQHKTALITGATSNIGRAIAVAYGAEGAHVIVSGRSAERGAAVVDEIRRGGGLAQFVPVDLDGSAATSRGLAVQAQDAVGGVIDILVNNAGIFPSTTGATADMDEATLDRIYAVNVKAPFFLTGALAPAMALRGHGAVINLGSWIARLGITSPAYSSSKGAIETLTRAWAAEFGPSGVRVNAISPGVIRERQDEDDPRTGVRSRANRMMWGTPYGRVGTPESIAYAAVYLASDEAEFVHGTVIDVDGGRTGVAVVHPGV